MLADEAEDEVVGDWVDVVEPRFTVSREFFTTPYPARTTVRADLMGTRIEVDALAVRP
jgi:enamine deaminase RidA (YjgF/YER057c/UK114 family)